MTLLDFSQQIFGNKGNNYSPAQIAATETNGADVLYGTAQIDADSGEVEVLIDGTEIPTDPDDPDYELASTMTCDTEELIQAGDRVTVVRNGQNAKAIVLSPESTGVAAAQQAADEAAAVAEATGQHFWHRSTDPDGDGAGTGAFVTDEEQDDFLAAAADGFSDYDPDTKPYANMLLNSLGVLIRNALNTFASFTKSAVSFFDSNGDTTATFGSSGATIGRIATNQNRMVLSSGGMSIFHRKSNPSTDVLVTEIGYGEGNSSSGTLREAPYFIFGEKETLGALTVGNYSVAEGEKSQAHGCASHAEGDGSMALGNWSHAEGKSTTYNNYSHAEGDSAARGDYSHSEGSGTVSRGYASHAQNFGCDAAKQAQTAIGSYNVVDTSATTTHPSGTTAYGDYALIIGNGTANNARSNALTVAWSGDITAAGEVTDGYGNKLSDVSPITPADTSWAYLAGSETSSYYCRWRCKSGWVQVEINYESGAAVPRSGSKLFGTIQSGYCPDRVVSVPCYFSSNNTGSAWVETDGEVRAVTMASSSQSTCYAAFSYPLD